MDERSEPQEEKTVSIEDFDLHCLEMIDQVEKGGTAFLITKGRKPFVRIIPVDRSKH